MKDLLRFLDRLSAYILKARESKISICFIAGCGHSGTSLLNAKLSNHSQIMGIGEETGILGFRKNPFYWKLINSLEALSRLVEVNEKSCLIEKTPKHVYLLDRLRRVYPNAYIILLVRNPLDNIASLHARYHNLEHSIKRWEQDNYEVMRWIKDKRVLIVNYDTLTYDPKNELLRVIKFLKLNWEDGLLAEGKSIYDDVRQIDNMAIRRVQVRKKIYARKDRWKEVLTLDEAEYVLSRTTMLYNKLLKAIE